MHPFFVGVFGFAAVVFAFGYLCYGVALLGGMWFARKDRAEHLRAMAAAQASITNLAQVVREAGPKKEPWE